VAVQRWFWSAVWSDQRHATSRRTRQLSALRLSVIECFETDGGV